MSRFFYLKFCHGFNMMLANAFMAKKMDDSIVCEDPNQVYKFR